MMETNTCKRCGRAIDMDANIEYLSYRIDEPTVGCIGGCQRLCNFCLSDFRVFMTEGSPKERIMQYLAKWERLHPSIDKVIQDMGGRNIPCDITIQALRELEVERRITFTLADDGEMEV